MMRQMFSIKPMKKALHPFFLLALACAIAVALPLTLHPQTRVTSPNLLPGESSTILPEGRSLLLGGETNGEVSPAATIWDPRTGTSRNCRRSLDMRGRGTPRRCCRTARF